MATDQTKLRQRPHPTFEADLADFISPTAWLPYLLSAVLLGSSAALWGLRLGLFSPLFTASVVLLAFAIAKDLHEKNIFARAMLLFLSAFVVQMPFSNALSLSINPMFALGLGAFIVWMFLHLHKTIAIGTTLLLIPTGFIVTPIIYGIFLVPVFYLITSQPAKRQLYLAMLFPLLLIPITLEQQNWLGLVITSLLIFPSLGSQIKNKATFISIIATISLLYFGFVLIKNLN
jgi:hypothetical protein